MVGELGYRARFTTVGALERVLGRTAGGGGRARGRAAGRGPRRELAAARRARGGRVGLRARLRGGRRAGARPPLRPLVAGDRDGTEHVPATGPRAARGQPRRRRALGRRDGVARPCAGRPGRQPRVARPRLGLLAAVGRVGRPALGGVPASPANAPALLEAGPRRRRLPRGRQGPRASRGARATASSASAAAASWRSRCAPGRRSSPWPWWAARRSTRSSPSCRCVARLLRAPYFPVTPTFPLLGPLGLVPLPSRWRIAFGAAGRPRRPTGRGRGRRRRSCST